MTDQTTSENTVIDSLLDLAAGDVLREAQELTHGRIGAAPGPRPWVQYYGKLPQVPTESEAAFLDAAHAFVVRAVNELPEPMRISVAYKMDVGVAVLWVSVTGATVAVVLEHSGACVEIARVERVILH